MTVLLLFAALLLGAYFGGMIALFKLRHFIACENFIHELLGIRECDSRVMRILHYVLYPLMLLLASDPRLLSELENKINSELLKQAA